MTGSHKRLAVTVLVALVLVANGIFWMLASRAESGSTLLSSTATESDSLIAATGTAEGGVISATRGNEVSAWDASLARTGSIQLEEPVGAIAPAPDGKVLVGTASGLVQAFDATFASGPAVQVDGRVLALVATDEGLFVAHGIGAFGVRFFISYFEPAATEPRYTYQIAQPITTMAPWQEGVVFGTANSNVGFMTPASAEEPVWMTQLAAPISRVEGAPAADGILVGNDRGAVTMLDQAGVERWTASIGQYAVRGLAFDPDTDLVLAGDANGALTALDVDGSTVYSGTVARETDLEAIVQLGDASWVVIPRSGEWRALDPGAASGATSASNLRLAWVIANGVLAVFATGVIVAVVDPYRKATLRILRQAWKARTGYLFALPAIALILLFSYYPAVMAFYYSFTNYSLRSITTWVGLDNYQSILFEDPYFRVGIKNMVIITITSIIKTLTIPLLIAELIFWLRNSWHSYIFRTLFILPTVVPGLVFTLMWRQIYDPDTGLINELLGLLGLEQWQRAWLGNPDTALWAIIGVGFPWVDAFALLILMGGLLNINSDYFDAAKVDGASVWQRFRNIDLPLLVPQFRILLFFAIAGTVQGFVAIFILTRGGPGMTTYIPALQMYMRISDGDFGYASAVGVILFLFILVATFLVLRLRRNEGVEDA